MSRSLPLKTRLNRSRNEKRITLTDTNARTHFRRSHLIAIVVLALAIATLVVLLHWGGEMLVASDPLPSHADVGVVLQGSAEGERVRLSGAMHLAQEGVIGEVLVSIPRESYWGQSIPPVARQYIERTYGPGLSNRTEFCETGPEVNSTEQEAAVLSACIRQGGWQSVVVVTSNYHTRRAGIIWHRVLRRRSLFIYGVDDPEFHPRSWWRERLSAKTWFFETTKLIWTLLVR